MIKVYNDKRQEIHNDQELKRKQDAMKDDAVNAAKKERDRERKLRFKKTKKGQPILGNQMASLLHKTEKVDSLLLSCLVTCSNFMK